MNEEIKDIQENKQEKPKKKILFNNLFLKLKKIKHLDKILTVLFIAIILLIYFSSFASFGVGDKKENKTGQATNDNSQVTNLGLYKSDLESRITKTISSIKDAGSVTCMVYFDKGIETVIAYKTEIQTNANGIKIETKSPVLITNNGQTQTVVLQENMPNPCSVVIVATGASNTNVKLEILRAVQAMFISNSCNIEVFAGN